MKLLTLFFIVLLSELGGQVLRRAFEAIMSSTEQDLTPSARARIPASNKVRYLRCEKYDDEKSKLLTCRRGFCSNPNLRCMSNMFDMAN
jgi:hypothetical protein